MKPKTTPFYKMVASGNDFVVIDNRRKAVRNPTDFARRICAPHTGIGADGILLFEKSKKADFRMRIINSDGSEAEACGNGFRCIALYARHIHQRPPRMRFESQAGMIEARVQNGAVRVELVNPSQIALHKELSVTGRVFRYSFVNTGVPHSVIFVEGLSKFPEIETLGRAIRGHRDFRPRGTNVNFVEIKGVHDIQVRTYERGVEKETLACGTGSSASAIISSLLNLTSPPIRVKTQSGETLTVEFKKANERVTHVTLEGKAHFVYEGKLW